MHRSLRLATAAAAVLTLSVASVAPTTLAAPAAALPGAPAAQAGCPGNLLQNPGFEGASHKTESEGTSLSSAVGNGWSPWFVRGNATWNREPEFKVEQTAIGGDWARVHSGANAMKWFTTWGTHTAGVYQRVAARAGTAYTFSMFAQAYSGEGDAFDPVRRTFISDREKPGNYRIMVGIDPTGAVPQMGSAPPASVVWSTPVGTVDEWVNLAVSTVAKGGAITVYTHSSMEFPVKHNDSFWDDACLRVGSFAPAGGVIASAPAAPAPAPAVPAPGAPVVVGGTNTTTTAPAQPIGATSGIIEGSSAGASELHSLAVTKGIRYTVTLSGMMDTAGNWNGAGFNVWGEHGRLGMASLAGGADSTVEFVAQYDGFVTVEVYNYHPGRLLSYRVVKMGAAAAN